MNEVFAHLELDVVPLKLLDIVDHFDLLALSSHLDHQLFIGLFEFIGGLFKQLLVSFAGLIQLLVKLREHIHRLHELVERSYLELCFVNLYRESVNMRHYYLPNLW